MSQEPKKEKDKYIEDFLKDIAIKQKRRDIGYSCLKALILCPSSRYKKLKTLVPRIKR